MRRSLYLIPPVILTAALVVGLNIGDAVSNPGTADATATTYTVSKTYGPYNGALPVDATVSCGPGCAQTAPGSVPDFEEAPSVACHNANDALLAGSATVNLKTSGHPSTSKATLDLDRIGAYYNPEDGVVPFVGWATWIRPNGKSGWNSVTISVTCLIRKAPQSVDTAPIPTVTKTLAPTTPPAPPSAPPTSAAPHTTKTVAPGV